MGGACRLEPRPDLLPTLKPESVVTDDSVVHIRSPRDGLRIVRDPEMPQGDSTLGLLAAASPANGQVVWYVDGAPYKTVGYPFRSAGRCGRANTLSKHVWLIKQHAQKSTGKN